MTETNKNMLDALIQHQVYSYRASTKSVNEIFEMFTLESNSFSSKLRDLLDGLTQAELDALSIGQYTTESLRSVRELFNDWSATIAVSLPESFAVSAISLAVYEANYIASLYGSEKEFNDGEKIFKKAKKQQIVGGQLFDEVWKGLASSTKDKALYAVREGIQNGLTTKEIVDQIKGKRTKQADGTFDYVGGIVQDTKPRIESAVRTIRSHVSQVAYEMTFDALGFTHKKFVATIDFRVSKVCGATDGKVWANNDPNIMRPPLHFNCRSVLIGSDADGNIDGLRPFVRSDKPVSKMSKAEREGNIGQIDANETFSTWLSKQDKSFQREYLGEKKFKLYSEGGYPLSRFIDPLGKEYTLKELKQLDQKTLKSLNL